MGKFRLKHKKSLSDQGQQQPPRKLNALEQSKIDDDGGPQFLENFMVIIFGSIPGLRSIFGLKEKTLNFDPRHLYFNSDIPEELIDSKRGEPKAVYSTNKVRTTKYTPLTFLPKNIVFQFQNVANIYFLMVAIFSGFTIFGVNNAGLASVPIIAIVVITALRDGFEDWRRQVLDLELNNTLTVVLQNIENHNSPIGSIAPWRKFKKSCSRFYRRVWYKLLRKRDPLIDDSDVNDNQSITTASMAGSEQASQEIIGSSDPTKPVFKREFWKNVRVGDVVKVYADEGVPADMVILSSSDREGDCFIDTRNLDGESSLKPRKAMNATKHVRRPWQISEMQFKVEVEGASADLESFGYNYTDLPTGLTEPILPINFLPRGSTVRNSRWVIGYVVYTGAESKIMLNSGETPTKRSRLSRDLNFYVTCSFVFLFTLCFISGVVEGVMFERKRNNIAYYFEEGLQTKNAALNGFVTFFAAMLVLQNLVPISLYISIEIARTVLAFFIYSDYYMYDDETDYPCTPKSWALSDDLGQIEYIFSDKTGTLTQNSMIFRKCTINGKVYGTAFTESMAGQLKRRNEDVDSIRKEMEAKIADERISMNQRLIEHYKNPYMVDYPELVSEPIIADMEGESGDAQSTKIEQFALTLALCNTVVVDSREATAIDELNRNERLSLSQTRSRTGGAGVDAQDGDDDVFNLPLPSEVKPEVEPARLSRQHTRNHSIVSLQSDRRGQSLDLKRTRTAEVFGGAGRKSVSSARPKQSLDYHRMEGKILLHKAESPDESALVTMARDLGYTLVEDGKHAKVVDMQGTFHRFQILQTILFSSHRKRMSIIVKNEANRYFVLLKGADSMVETLLSEKSRMSQTYRDTMAQLETFGDEGLRTLMVAYKELSPEYAISWSKKYTEASTTANRGELLEQLAEEVENDLELIGGTGIEDQLQEDVPNTIEVLARAGIKLWMLTGDKVETAISIGFSCNLLDTSMNLLIVKRPEELAERLHEMGLEVNKQTLKEAGDDHRPPQGKHALIIDGNALSQLMSSQQYRLQFALLGKKCKSVLCCRVSPSQKAAVVHIMKSTFDVMTIAVGDGANDVSMIQEADVGIGIVGVEGRQAAMSSDFAIGQFRFLQRLLLVHGRWSYMRVTSMIDTLLFENFMFSLTLFWYNIWAQYDQSYLYDYTYLTLFNSVFVSIPVVARGILDQDLPDHVLLKNPELYATGILRQAWTKRKYLITLVDGLYQSAVAYFFVYSIFFDGKFYSTSGMDMAYRQGMGVLVCATAVFACNTYVMLGQYRWDWISVLAYIVSNGLIFAWTGIYTCFVASNFFYRSAEFVYDTMIFWAYFLLSLTAAVMPRFCYVATQRIWFPTDVDIVREDYHKHRKNTWWSWIIPGDAEKISEEEYMGGKHREANYYDDLQDSSISYGDNHGSPAYDHDHNSPNDDAHYDNSSKYGDHETPVNYMDDTQINSDQYSTRTPRHEPPIVRDDKTSEPGRRSVSGKRIAFSDE